MIQQKQIFVAKISCYCIVVMLCLAVGYAIYDQWEFLSSQTLTGQPAIAMFNDTYPPRTLVELPSKLPIKLYENDAEFLGKKIVKYGPRVNITVTIRVETTEDRRGHIIRQNRIVTKIEKVP